MTPTRAQELAVLRSVTYAALFDYPLTLEQLHASLIDVRADADTVAAWWRNSALLQATVEHRDGFVLSCRARRSDRARARGARPSAASCSSAIAEFCRSSRRCRSCAWSRCRAASRT